MLRPWMKVESPKSTTELFKHAEHVLCLRPRFTFGVTIHIVKMQTHLKGMHRDEEGIIQRKPKQGPKILRGSSKTKVLQI